MKKNLKRKIARIKLYKYITIFILLGSINLLYLYLFKDPVSNSYYEGDQYSLGAIICFSTAMITLFIIILDFFNKKLKNLDLLLNDEINSQVLEIPVPKNYEYNRQFEWGSSKNDVRVTIVFKRKK